MDVPCRLALFGLEHLPLHMANRLSVCSNNRSKPRGLPPYFVRRILALGPAIGAFQFWRFVNSLPGVTPHHNPTDETNQDCLADGLYEPASESVALDLLIGKHTYSPTVRISAFILQESISINSASSMILPNTPSRSAELDPSLIMCFSEEASVQFQEAWLCKVPAQDVPSDRQRSWKSSSRCPDSEDGQQVSTAALAAYR
jgi:hypothetical protein